jgi:general secretion pathway protein I
MMGYRQGRTKGFTLMEVMIAMAILAIALTAVYRSQSQSVAMSTNARFLTTASLLAQAKMAEADALSPRDVMAGQGDFGENYPDYEWRLETEDHEMGYVKKIHVVVTNKKMLVNNEYDLTLYKIVTR